MDSTWIFLIVVWIAFLCLIAWLSEDGAHRLLLGGWIFMILFEVVGSIGGALGWWSKY